MPTFKAYAKINLGLRVLRKREDGYHDIETIFHRIDLFDEVILTPAPDLSFECDAADLGPVDTNLAFQAARLLKATYSVRVGAHIFLKKRIPAGAGLGGGSSDAAATLLGLTSMWNLRLSPEQLLPLAVQLGSDVPYFLREGSAFGTGRGEILEYFPLVVPYWILLVIPNIVISTAWAYAQSGIIQKDSTARSRATILRQLNDPAKWQNLFQNDFESVAFKAFPELAEIKRSLIEGGALFAQMSGSGSTVYGLYSDEEMARKAGDSFSEKYRVEVIEPGRTSS